MGPEEERGRDYSPEKDDTSKTTSGHINPAMDSTALSFVPSGIFFATHATSPTDVASFSPRHTAIDASFCEWGTHCQIFDTLASADLSSVTALYADRAPRELLDWAGAHLPHLRVLDVSGTSLKALPVAPLTALRVLIARQSAVDARIPPLPALQTLVIDFAPSLALDATFWRSFPSLRALCAVGCRLICDTPAMFARVPSCLEYVNFRHCRGPSARPLTVVVHDCPASTLLFGSTTNVLPVRPPRRLLRPSRPMWHRALKHVDLQASSLSESLVDIVRAMLRDAEGLESLNLAFNASLPLAAAHERLSVVDAVPDGYRSVHVIISGCSALAAALAALTSPRLASAPPIVLRVDPHGSPSNSDDVLYLLLHGAPLLADSKLSTLPPPLPEFEATLSAPLRHPVAVPPEIRRRRLRAAVLGAAYGDALGLATEFVPSGIAHWAFHLLPPLPGLEGTRYAHPAVSASLHLMDHHRARWALGDATDDTDQGFSFLKGVSAAAESRGGSLGQIVADLADVASHQRRDVLSALADSLLSWIEHGFPELADVAGFGVGRTVAAVISTPSFTKDPHSASAAVWESCDRSLAANGAVMRFWAANILAAVAPVPGFALAPVADALARLTHADQRASVAAVAAAEGLAAIIASPCEEGGVEAAQTSMYAALGHTIVGAFPADGLYEEGSTGDAQKAEMLRYCACAPHPRFLPLSPHHIGYAPLTLGGAVAAVRAMNMSAPWTAVLELASCGGDADTNCAVAGAFIGALCALSEGLAASFVADAQRLLPPHVLAWMDAQLTPFLDAIV
jgi:ADP-ribosylglycohydrolase